MLFCNKVFYTLNVELAESEYSGVIYSVAINSDKLMKIANTAKVDSSRAVYSIGKFNLPYNDHKKLEEKPRTGKEFQ